MRWVWIAVIGCAGRDVPTREERRCTVRVTTAAVFVDGDRATESDVITICKRTAGAMVTVEDDARWIPLRDAFATAGVRIHLRGALNDSATPPPRRTERCDANPLAKGCGI